MAGYVVGAVVLSVVAMMVLDVAWKQMLWPKSQEEPYERLVEWPAENYRVDGKDEQGVAELPGRKAYTISDEHRLWYLHFSDIPNPQLIETAAEAFWDGSTAGEK